MVQMKESAGTSKTIVKEKKIDYCRYFVDKLVFAVFTMAAGALLSLFISVSILESFEIFSRLERELRVTAARSLLAIIAMVIIFFIVLLYRKVFRKEVSLTELKDGRFELMLGKERCNHRKSDLKKVQMVYRKNRNEEVKRRTLLVKIKNRSFRFSSKGERDELDTMYKYLDTWKRQADKSAEYRAETGWFETEGNQGNVRILEYLRYSKTPFLRTITGALFGLLGIALLLFFMLTAMIIPRLFLDDFYTIPTLLGLGVSFVLFRFYVMLPLRASFNRLFKKEIILVDSGDGAFEISIAGEWRKHRKKEISDAQMFYRRGKNSSVIGRTLYLKVNGEVFRFASDGDFDSLDIMQSYLDMWRQGIGPVEVRELLLEEQQEEELAEELYWVEEEVDFINGEIVEKLRYSKIPFLKTVVGTIFNIVGILAFLLFLGGGLWGLLQFTDNPSKIITIPFLLIIIVLSVIFIATPLEKIYDKIFCKNVTLIDSTDGTFELKIANERCVYQKSEIENVRMDYRKDKNKRITSRALIITMQDRVFHFSSSGKRDRMDDMYRHLEIWKRQTDKIAEYKAEIDML
ncbi:hypothetical protein [Enterococcus larvae]|uniref:hypothetical protein n=1 Tax=Enterococcus larvae TaxID=2794352 RepID=UPI003F3F8D7E